MRKILLFIILLLSFTKASPILAVYTCSLDGSKPAFGPVGACTDGTPFSTFCEQPCGSTLNSCYNDPSCRPDFDCRGQCPQTTVGKDPDCWSACSAPSNTCLQAIPKCHYGTSAQDKGGNCYTDISMCPATQACPVGTTAASGGTYACESSCISPNQVDSSKTCSNGGTCCIKKPLPICQCKSQSQVQCGVGNGYTSTPGVDCTTEGATPILQCGTGDACASAGTTCIVNEAGRKECGGGDISCTWTACSNPTCGGTKTCMKDGVAQGKPYPCGDKPVCPTPQGSCTLQSTSVTNTSVTAAYTGDTGGYDKTDWWIKADNASTKNFLGTNANTNSASTGGLSPGQGYTMEALMWSSTNARTAAGCSFHFTTGQPSVPTGNLQCWGPAGISGNDVARWAQGQGTGVQYTPNLNLPGSPNYKVGEGCYRKPGTYSPPAGGSVGGYIYTVPVGTSIQSLVARTAPLTKAPPTIPHIFYWTWSTDLQQARPICPVNNGLECMTGSGTTNYWLSGTNTFQGDVLNQEQLYTAAEIRTGPGPSGIAGHAPNHTKLISWPANMKPIGYYAYQAAENVGGGRQACKEISQKRFYYWGGWVCDGCTAPPGNGPVTMTNYGDNAGAYYCTVDPGTRNDSGPLGEVQAYSRIDWVFEEVPYYDVIGTVFLDTNQNGIKEFGEAGFNGANINLTGGATKSITSGVNGLFSFLALDSNSYTATIEVPIGFKATTPTTQSFTLGPNKTLLFGVDASYTISGTVCLDANNNGAKDAGEGGIGGVVLNILGRDQFSNTITRSTQTATSGSYILQNIPMGSYLLTAVPPTQSRIVTTSNPISMNLNTNTVQDFCVSAISPWLQTSGGSVYSGKQLNIPGGP